MAINLKSSLEKEILQEVLVDALSGKQAHVTVERALEGLTWRQSGNKVPQSPHTIWQLLKHLNYWQDRFISRIEGLKVLPAKSSDDGWAFPTAPQNEAEYKQEVGKLLTGIHYITETLLQQKDLLLAPKGDYPHGYGVIRGMASHQSYHLGEIVLLRRILGLWPPPSGGYSW